MSHGTRWLLALVAILALGTAMAAEPPLRLSDDGTAFLYRSQPGDLPGAVAERFGVRDLPAFLAANGIIDPTRVGSDHVYRIENPLAERALAAEARAVALNGEAETARERARTLETEAAALRAQGEDLQRRSASLARLARFWPWVQILGVVLALGIAVAAYAAFRAVRDLRQAERYGRELAGEVDQRRRQGLAERQESARRILNLEEEVRFLQHELAMAHRRPTGTH